MPSAPFSDFNSLLDAHAAFRHMVAFLAASSSHFYRQEISRAIAASRYAAAPGREADTLYATPLAGRRKRDKFQ